MNWSFFTSKEFYWGAGGLALGIAGTMGFSWAREKLFQRELESIKKTSDFSVEKKLEKMAELFRQRNDKISVGAARHMAAAALEMETDRFIQIIEDIHEAAQKAVEKGRRKQKGGGEAEAA